ncbi:4'-phosphopantetheinyl transferase superfamily protein [Vibrio sp. S9_S30]|uniref:4'-phosphopantetheinyl transferase family protein n=1 Tax=Vibrio sp. S9_S30 TaxID=2720226 RepID=UPI001680306B|nr:4'-phosphopantetheinyl transferase superfamily protein [Vibrio sp. S9_S30]MBD1557622.1 4'-phosphopantetheinyl transferase superfamily protein [Vibrio sp. S9_S30]
MSFLSELEIRTLGSQKIWQRRFDVNAYSDLHSQTLNVTLPHDMKRAVAKRKAEFVAGRTVARAALQSLGCTCVELPIGEHRAPVWPKGWIGSISHTDDMALAVVGLSGEVSMLGLDVENLIAETQLDSLMPMFVSAKELELLPTTTLSRQAFATLVFSAKESVFKAIYPYVKTYLEFTDSMLTRVDMTKGEAYFTLCAQGEAEFGDALALRVSFLFEDNKVYTLVCDHRKYLRS